MKTLLLLLLAAGLVQASDYKFKHFRLKNKLRAKRVRGGELTVRANLPINSPIPMSPILASIRDFVSERYQQMAQDRIDGIDKFNNSFDLGQKNFSGMNWQKPFGSFDVGAVRVVSPDLFDINRWIIDDTLTVTVDAKTYLEKLQKNGSIDISTSALKAFAGIQFKRVYRHVHFAPTYKDALLADPSKLFLGFLQFNPKHMAKMNDYEIMSKEDFLTTEAGFYAGLPLQYGFHIEAGGRLNYERVSELVVQKLGPEDISNGEESVRLSFVKEKGKQMSAALGLTLDFLNIIKITLFSFDLEYEYREESALHLHLLEEDLDSDTPAINQELRDIFRMSVFEPKNLEPRIVSEETRVNDTFTSRYSSLFSTGSSSKAKQKVRIKQDDETRLYIKLNSEKVDQRNSVFATLINDFLDSLTELPMHVDESIESVRHKLSLDYETFTGNTKQDYIKNQNLSLQINHEYRAQVTDHSYFKKTKERAVDFLYKNTTLELDVIGAFKKNKLKGPLRVRTQINIANEGVYHLMEMSNQRYIYAVATICNYTGKIKWNMDRARNSKERCVVDLLEVFKELQKTSGLYIQLPKTYELFVSVLQKHLKAITHYIDLFGEQNVKINGSFFSKTDTGQNFQTYFMMGKSRSRGVIEDRSFLPLM